MGELTQGQGNLNNENNTNSTTPNEENKENSSNTENEENKENGESGKGEESTEENNKGETDQPQEQPGDSGTSEEGGESSSENSGIQKPKEEKWEVYIPGLGNVTLKDLDKMGVLNGEFDKMFDKELTTEQRQIIANYLDLLKQ